MSKHRLADSDLSARLGRAPYKARLKQCQHRLRRIELAYKFAQLRAVIVIEGWDAVGKGGLIRRMTSVLDPRGYKVWPIGPPTDAERGEQYLQRFWRKLPPAGTMALFDRSWYGRVLVERVEQLASPAEWRRGYDEINAFERMLADDGVRLVKLFLHISATEQLRRLRNRIADPMERWKMSSADIRNYHYRDDYARAVDDMTRHTDSPHAQWCVVPFEDKRFGRIAAMEHAADVLAAGMDLSPPPLAADVVAAAAALSQSEGKGDGAKENAARRRRPKV